MMESGILVCDDEQQETERLAWDGLLEFGQKLHVRVIWGFRVCRPSPAGHDGWLRLVGLSAGRREAGDELALSLYDQTLNDLHVSVLSTRPSICGPCHMVDMVLDVVLMLCSR
jgi:hypothetical protein